MQRSGVRQSIAPAYRTTRAMIVVLVGILLAGTPLAQALPVIPGAAGYGMDTPAGRGGQVIKVTNLNATGSGSLKACIDASGPRVCVFEVSGTINLTSDIAIRNPYITIAGQTAPSPGITIRGAALWVQTSHVLIQHLRIRVGDDPVGPHPENRDALKISNDTPTGLSHVVIDHCSFSWALDEAAGTWGTAGNVTFWKNIFSEALHDSMHPKGAHGYGPLFGPDGNTRVTMYGNLMAHNVGRNPLSRASELVMVNNTIYDWMWNGTDLQGEHGIVTNNTIIGNYYKPGPSTRGAGLSMRGEGRELDMTRGSKVYVEGNFAREYDAANPWAVVRMGILDDSYKAASPPVWNDGLAPLPHVEAYEMVLRSAGARPADRDSVDERIVQQVRLGQGGIIDSQNDVGGWPDLPVNHRQLKIPEDPNGDADGDGYTNLEEWLHSYAWVVEGTRAYAEIEVSRNRHLITPTGPDLAIVVPFGAVDPPLIEVVAQDEMRVRRILEENPLCRITQASTIPGSGLVEVIGGDGSLIHTSQINFYMARPNIHVSVGGREQKVVRALRDRVSLAIDVNGPASMINRIVVDLIPVSPATDSRLPGVAPIRVYEGADLPSDLVLDTFQWEDGWYNLLVTVEAEHNLISDSLVRLNIDNWVMFADELKPPVEGGWFGIIDNRRTFEESDGWVYATDKPEAFFGDGNRVVRSDSSEQYLIWESSGFRNYGLTLYAQDANVENAIELAVSTDGETWQPIAYSKAVISTPETGWHRVVLSGEISEYVDARYLRFTLCKGGSALDALQLGRVQFEELTTD
jgi:hypothetical protein